MPADILGQGPCIREKQELPCFVLRLNPGTQGTGKVADMKRAGGPVPGQDGRMVGIRHRLQPYFLWHQPAAQKQKNATRPGGVTWKNGPPDSGVPPTPQFQRDRFRIHGRSARDIERLTAIEKMRGKTMKDLGRERLPTLRDKIRLRRETMKRRVE